MNDDQFIAYLRGKDAAERHVLFLCDLRARYESAKKKYDAGESQAPVYGAFLNDYCRFKTYKNLHGWGEGFIRDKFGYSSNAFKALYYGIQKSC